MKYRPFEELFDIPLRNGLTKPKRVRGEGYKMVNMGELFRYSRMKNIPMDRVPLNEKEQANSMIKAGDLLFARQSLVLEGAGQCSIFMEDNEEVCFESHLIRCRLNKEIANPLFYYYFFSSRTGKLAINAIVEQGAGAAGVRGSDLEKILVPDVDIDFQNKVAEVLDQIDSKIEINRLTNQTLEQISQAFFKSWFVDFEPVKAKAQVRISVAEGKMPGCNQNTPLPKDFDVETAVESAAMCAISGKTLEELEQLSSETKRQLKTTAALFPDTLIESDLGEIPEDWKLDTLSNIATYSSKRIDISELTLENYISTENMLKGKKGISIASSLPTVKSVPYFNDAQILISNIRPYFKKIWLSRFEGGRSNDVLGIEAIDSDCVEFLYNLLYQDVFFNFMMTTSKGAKMPRGDKVAIMDWLCVQPTSEITQYYSKFVRNFYRIIDSITQENESLERIRSSLLPKLLSGELKTNFKKAA